MSAAHPTPVAPAAFSGAPRGAGGGTPGGLPAVDPPAADGGADEPTEVRIVGVAPKVVSPAWELELLISGAVTFGLLQLPDAIDRARLAVQPQVTGAGDLLLFFANFYAKGTVYALLVTFVLNLAARAYWVGLVGLHSVYPAGPRWEEYRSGPFMRAQYQRRMRPLPATIARVDDFASVLFSFGFLIAMITAGSFLILAVLAAVAVSISRLVPGAPRAQEVLRVLFLMATVPFVLIPTADKLVGARLRPGGAAARAMQAGTRLIFLLSGAWLIAPVFITLFTNFRSRRFYTLFYAAFFGVVLATGAGILADAGRVDAGTALYAPEDPDLRSLHASHYESMRQAGDPAGAVTIQADVIADPYARLFIPYEAEPLNAAIPARCPGVRPQRAAGIHLVSRPGRADTAGAARAADAVLACLARIYDVALDGRPVDGLGFRFTRHPITRQPGVVAHVPLTGLALGEHRLTVHAPPPAPGSNRRAQPPLDIPFWR